jgi:hypothetical protein
MKTYKKFPEIFFMPETEKIYHIYAKDKCLFHSLKEDEFKRTWNTLQNLVDILDTRYAGDDLTYEELVVNKKVVGESSY